MCLARRSFIVSIILGILVFSAFGQDQQGSIPSPGEGYFIKGTLKSDRDSIKI